MKSKSKQINFNEFPKFLKTDSANSYFIFGEDNYQKDIILRQIIKKYTNSESRDYDFVSCYADEISMTGLIEELDQPPFFASKRLIMIRDFEKYDLKSKNRLADYYDRFNLSSVLVIISEKTETTKAVKKIQNHSIWTNCRKPYNSSDMATWIRNQARENNLRIDSSAISIFAELIELDYMIAANELEKLAIFASQNRTISSEDVIECVGQSRINTIFELQNSLGERNVQKTLQIAGNILSNDESGVFIIVMLTRFFLILWKIRILLEKNYSENTISEQYLPAIHRMFRNNYIRYAKNYRLKEIRKIFSFLLNADCEIKTSSIKETVLIEMMLFNILRVNTKA
ncbi:MAG: DNA polymerase III subunit delta [Candidatus Cloacimonetes bacterium]|nr:DNA polymerase III subunit delta [Candidatus Cloacimonadota bacterium]